MASSLMNTLPSSNSPSEILEHFKNTFLPSTAEKYQMAYRNITALDKNQSKEQLEIAFEEAKPHYDDFKSIFGYSKEEYAEQLKTISAEKITDECKKVKSILRQDINNRYQNVLWYNLLVLFYQADNLMKLTAELESIKKTVQNENLFKQLNDIIEQIKVKIKEIEDNLEVALLTQSTLDNIKAKNKKKLNGLKNDLERLNKRATHALLKIDKTLDVAKEKLDIIQKSSRDNLLTNTISTAVNSYRLYTDFNMLNNVNKIFGALETAVYAILAIKNYQNYNETQKQLDGLNQMRIIYDDLANEIELLNDLTVEIRNKIDETTD